MPRLLDESVDLGPLEGKGRAFRVVLVVGVRAHGGGDELVEVSGQLAEA
ncbi:MAG TPA: hypothetical protein VFC48_09045 [Cellulomonas sp.]|nr:hypothetical protein [Cellulomonas sp.]